MSIGTKRRTEKSTADTWRSQGNGKKKEREKEIRWEISFYSNGGGEQGVLCRPL